MVSGLVSNVVADRSEAGSTGEEVGLIIIVVLILEIPIIRSWHHVNWSAR